MVIHVRFHPGFTQNQISFWVYIFSKETGILRERRSVSSLYISHDQI